MNSNNQYKLTDKDFQQINKRSLFAYQLGWNYERMQNSGYLYTILPQLCIQYCPNFVRFMVMEHLN